VSSSAQLRSALSDHRSDAVVLADGTYDNGSSFSDREGDRLYAAHLGRAVLRAGVVLGANAGPSGAALRGIRFDVDDPAKTFQGSIVHVWGSASHASVRDTWLDGNGVVDGLIVRQPEGFVAQRVVARALPGYGVLVDPNEDHYRARIPYVLGDLAISQVMRPVPGSSNGTAESCLWLGSTGTVKRVSAASCAVSGIWTGTANTGSHVQDVTVDRTPVGIYIEHFTTGTTFRRLRIGPNVDRGVNAEWASPSNSGKPASVDNVIEAATSTPGSSACTSTKGRPDGGAPLHVRRAGPRRDRRLQGRRQPVLRQQLQRHRTERRVCLVRPRCAMTMSARIVRTGSGR
jgi:hypothetical protein